MRKRYVVRGFASCFGLVLAWLDMLLLLNVRFDDGERCSSRRTHTHKIPIGPQGGQCSLQHREFLTQETRRTACDQLDQAMNTKLRINAYPQMDMIRHHFQFLNFGLMLLAHVPNNLFESLFNWRNQHTPRDTSDTRPHDSGRHSIHSGCSYRMSHP